MQAGALHSQMLLFDDRYSFDIFTEFPLEQDFPFQVGDRLQLEVFIVSHPVHDQFLQNISPDLLWCASVYPFGQPDPADPFGETLLLNIQAAQALPFTWRFPWRVDHDVVLVAYLEDESPIELLERAVNNPGLSPRLEVSLVVLEKIEADIPNKIQTMRMIMKPAGEQRTGRVAGRVEWLQAE